MIDLSETFEELGINFISIQDNVDTSTSMESFFFRVMASLAELENDIMIERTKSGLEAARMREKKKDDQVKPVNQLSWL